MVHLYEAAIGALLVVLLLWIWRLGGGGVRSNRLAGLLALAVLAAFFWPWIVHADWGLVARVGAVGLVAGAVVLVYARMLARARAAARRRDAGDEADGDA